MSAKHFGFFSKNNFPRKGNETITRLTKGPWLTHLETWCFTAYLLEKKYWELIHSTANQEKYKQPNDGKKWLSRGAEGI